MAFDRKVLNPRLFRRVLLYLLGNFVLAFGVAVAVKSDLGITPVNSIAYVTSRISSLDHGLATFIIYSGYVLLQIVILRREFNPVSFLQIAVAGIFGLFVSINNSLLLFPVPEAYWIKIALMFASVVIIALGIMLYLTAGLLPQPAEGLLLAVQKKTGWKLSNIKMSFDCSVVAIAAAVSFIAVHRIIGIREGTLIAMLGVGRIMGFFFDRLNQKIGVLFRL